MYQTKSAVLFLIFNRPEETYRVFQAIQLVKPNKLYIAADGPRVNNKNDIKNCAETRKVINLIDWPCDLKLLLQKQNLGCGLAVGGAISWFFEHEPEGVILEDDCLPNQDFFRFCDIMLEKYRYDSRIGHISGTNVHDYIKRGSASYYFSRLTAIWGWASWSRVWNQYDYHLNKLEQAIKEDFLESVTDSKHIKKAITKDFIQTRNGIINTWDYQYFFSHIINNYLSIIPNTNTISNIGFGRNGTHTLNYNKEYTEISTKKMDEKILHPQLFLPNRAADEFALDKATPKMWHLYYLKLKDLIKL